MSKKSNYYKRQQGRCALQQNPWLLQWTLSRLVAWASTTRCTGLTHSFLWHRWLTSRPPPGNCDLVKCIWTIRTTRCTRSSLFPSSGQLTHITPYPCLSVAPPHLKQSPGPPSLSLLAVNVNFKSLKSTSILTIFSIWVLLFRPQSHDLRWLGRYREKSTNYSPHGLPC